ncbi:MAG: prenyltransferase [Candidatus Nomurabacteria bacterium]|nr:MAG: prenyltransferase [Candidatus Nomurabacteria bacterium]
MFDALKKLFVISRPISWPNTAYPFAAAYVVTGGTLDITFWVATLFFLIPYNLLMYGVNDVFDYESDMRNPRKGGIEGAREQKAFHPTILWSSTLSTLPFVVWLFATGTVVSNAVLVALVFFVLAYSMAGLRFKEIPVLDSVTSSIHFVGPMVYAMVLTGFKPEYIPFVVAFFLWGVASHALGAVQDIIPDREGKLASVATVFGARATTRIVFGLYLASSAIMMTLGLLPAIVGATGLLYAANVAPYLHVTDKTSGMVNKAWRRFIWLNLITGFVVTMVLIVNARLL